MRAYSKHQASYIFRVQDLDLVGLARTFGLLRLPRMPELNGRAAESWEDADVNVCHSYTSFTMYHDNANAIATSGTHTHTPTPQKKRSAKPS